MTLVFPLVRASQDCIELRYALRSMMFLNPDRVILIGYKPKWIKNVEHYPFLDKPGIMHKEENIYNKLRFAFELCEEFLYCNDDHFLMPGFWPLAAYYNGNLEELRDKIKNAYRNTIDNTAQYTTLKAISFDCHCPIYLKQPNFKNLEMLFPPVFWRPWGFCIKTLYIYFNKYDTVQNWYKYPDLKINGQFNPEELKNRLYFSVSDRGLTNYFLFTLEKMFPQKSKYE